MESWEHSSVSRCLCWMWEVLEWMLALDIAMLTWNPSTWVVDTGASRVEVALCYMPTSGPA